MSSKLQQFRSRVLEQHSRLSGGNAVDVASFLSARLSNATPPLPGDIPNHITLIPVEEIADDGTYQYRLQTDVGELARDIQTRGQTTPIFVRPHNDKYQLVSGFRRVAALQLLGQIQALARVFHGLTHEQAVALAISENLQREDFSDLEKALVCQRLVEMGVDVPEIAHAVNRSPRTVYDYLTVLKAPPVVRDALHARHISLTVAFELARGGVSEQALQAVLSQAASGDLSVREVKQLLRTTKLKERTVASAPEMSTKKEGRGVFVPVRLVSYTDKGFDLTIKFRRQRSQDLELIIESLKKTLSQLEKEKARIS
jgi:ParB/RepB/Spo0J family partition protein